MIQDNPNDPIARFWRELREELSELNQMLHAWWGRSLVAWRNWTRKARRQRVDFVLLELSGALPERTGPGRPFWQRWLPIPTEPLTLQAFSARAMRIPDAQNAGGIIIRLDGLGADVATLQSVRDIIGRLREAGKRTVVFSPIMDLPHYYVATAADTIIAPPSADFEVLGLYAETLFLKDALARLGLQAEFVQISPYKSAPDQFTRDSMSAEMREEISWLLDDQYEQLLTGMAEGRGLTVDAMRGLIDRAPCSAVAAAERGLIDHVAYEDELPALLALPAAVAGDVAPGATEEKASDATDSNGGARPPRARIRPWSSASQRLLERYRQPTAGAVAVISVEGAIAPGQNRQPPINLPLPLLGGSIAGEETIVKLLRRFEQRDDLKALILHVDSPGGVALAADLIHREVERIARKKPIVAYMGATAASGGYYISAPVCHIVAQPGTFTGSVGVFKGKVALSGLFEQLDAHHVSLQRGERAGLYRSPQPLTPEERALFEESIQEAYGQFKEVVARGRDLPLESLDPICNGRVWTGRQALARGLVDSLGDFSHALEEAARLAGLPTDDRHAVHVLNMYSTPGRRPLPGPIELPEALAHWWQSGWLRELTAGKTLFLLPVHWRLW
jgi:protease-4